jgi:hypothetical protein
MTPRPWGTADGGRPPVCLPRTELLPPGMAGVSPTPEPSQSDAYLVAIPACVHPAVCGR